MAEPAPAAPETGALTLDQAVGLLGSAVERKEPDTSAGAETSDEETNPSPESQGDDDTAPADEPASGEDDAEVLEPPETAAIEAPHSWDAEAKANFEKLPPELQTYLSTREADRDKAVSTAQREAAEVRSKAETDLGLVQQLTESLSVLIPDVLKTHKDRWGTNPDWDAIAEEHGTDEAFKLKNQWEREKADIAKLAATKADADVLAHNAYVAGEVEKLKTIAPALMDPKEGPQRRQDMAKYLTAQGATPTQIRDLGALEASIAYKAMLWDRAQASLKNKPANPGGRPAAVPQVRPATAQNTSSSQRTVAAVADRFAAKPNVDNAVAMMAARRARKTG